MQSAAQPVSDRKTTAVGLACRRVRTQHRIRHILDRQGVVIPARWTAEVFTSIAALAKPPMICDSDEIWRGALWAQLHRLQRLFVPA